MGAYRTADSPGQTWWPQAQGRCARSREWDHVRVEHGVPMALCAQGPAAQKYALRLFRSLDLRRHVGDYPSCALCEVPRTNRPRGHSPTAAIIDSQSVKSAEKGGAASTQGGKSV